MAQLIVRNIGSDVVEALKREAAQHGRSAEAEHREILRRHLIGRPKLSLKDHLTAMPDVGEDSDFEIERAAARHVQL